MRLGVSLRYTKVEARVSLFKFVQQPQGYRTKSLVKNRPLIDFECALQFSKVWRPQTCDLEKVSHETRKAWLDERDPIRGWQRILQFCSPG